MKLICPTDKSVLELSTEGNVFNCPCCRSKYPIEEGVICFLEKKDLFYEGEYKVNLTTIGYLPKGQSFLWKIPLWMINSGYPWYVGKYVREGSTILELGCGGGVRYFGKAYKTIGLDLSHRALKKIANEYQYCLMADAEKIPLKDESVDAVVSAYFWEHIEPKLKPTILAECRRILKPGGKIVFLYDVETRNILINQLKKKSMKLYSELFLEKDGHVGYQSVHDNIAIFENSSFMGIKHIGLERTLAQSSSAYAKLIHAGGVTRGISQLGVLLNKSKLFYAYNLILRIIDSTVGKLFPIEHSRIMISILQKK